MPRALIFDVFGTLVDWRTAIAREAQQCLSPLGIQLDWGQLADAWRAQYQPSMEEIRSGRQPFVKLDTLHRQNLDHVLAAYALNDVDNDTRQQLTMAWHRLDAWPDVLPGLQQLRPHYQLAPCSNAHIALMISLARRNSLPWDAILGAELVHDYKPKALVYTASVAALALPAAEVVMVAAHSSDLAAAAAAGLATAFIARPDEHGPNTGELQPSVAVNYRAASLLELAQQLT